MWRFERFRDRFALGVGIYIGSWGVNFYIDFWQFSLSFESRSRQHPVKAAPDQTVDTVERRLI